jgi:hypothetical protein
MRERDYEEIMKRERDYEEREIIRERDYKRERL